MIIDLQHAGKVGMIPLEVQEHAKSGGSLEALFKRPGLAVDDPAVMRTGFVEFMRRMAPDPNFWPGFRIQRGYD